MHHTNTVKAALERSSRHSITMRDERTNGFTVLESYDIFASTYKSIKSPNMHEVITGNQKFRFDVDGDMEAHEVFAKSSMFGGTLWDLFIETIQAYFHLHYDTKLPMDNIVICDSSDESKFSRHVIIDGYYVEDHHEAKWFALEVYNGLPTSIQKYIDTGVYKSTQNFRLAGSTKVGSNRVKKIISKHKLSDSMISYVANCIRLKSIRSLIDAPEHIEIDDKLMNEAVKLIEPQMDGYSLTKAGTNTLTYKRTMPTHCNICDRTHDNVGCWVSIEHTNGILRMFKHCYRGTGSVELIVKVTDQSMQDTPLTCYVNSLKDTVPAFRHLFDRMTRSGVPSEKFYMSIRKDIAKTKEDHEKNQRQLKYKKKKM